MNQRPWKNFKDEYQTTTCLENLYAGQEAVK